MDIISMQIANKVLKRMNTEYNGVYDVFTATQGQKTFTLSKVVETSGHVLKVFVDGVLAIEGVDYTRADANTVTFVVGLDAGSNVLLTTEVTGVPKMEVVYPPYNDTTVKNDITSVTTRAQNLENSYSTVNTRLNSLDTEVAAIKSALDEDGDGSIIDTIADIKSAWQGADATLQTFVDSKADKTTVQPIVDELTTARGAEVDLNSKLNAIVATIPLAYDDTSLTDRVDVIEEELVAASTGHASVNARLTTIEDSIPTDEVSAIQTELALARGGQSSLGLRVGEIVASIPPAYNDSAVTSRVSALETKKIEDFVLVDDVTGFEYKIKVSNGSLVAKLLKYLQSVSISRVGNGTIYKGDSVTFTSVATYDDSSIASGEAVVVYNVDNTLIANIDSATGVLTAIEEGSVIVSVSVTCYGVVKNNNVVIEIYLTDAQSVEKAKSNLDIGPLTVIGDIVLPTNLNGCTIIWSSSDVAHITDAGVVTRPLTAEPDAVVTMTATIEKGVATDTKEFIVTVTAMP